MGVFWLLVCAALGVAVGWELKGLMVERRQREPEVDEDLMEEFPIARIANDIITQALGALSLVELKKVISRTWAPYDALSEHDQFIVLRDVTRRIYGGS
jgi:hypothetical protein